MMVKLYSRKCMTCSNHSTTAHASFEQTQADHAPPCITNYTLVVVDEAHWDYADGVLADSADCTHPDRLEETNSVDLVRLFPAHGTGEVP